LGYEAAFLLKVVRTDYVVMGRRRGEGYMRVIRLRVMVKTAIIEDCDSVYKGNKSSASCSKCYEDGNKQTNAPTDRASLHHQNTTCL
jgi:hypothetical protein